MTVPYTCVWADTVGMVAEARDTRRTRIGIVLVLLGGLALIAVGFFDLLPVIAGIHPSRWSAVLGGLAVVIVAAVNLWRIQNTPRGR